MEACHLFVCSRVQLTLAMPIKRKATLHRKKGTELNTISYLSFPSNAGPTWAVSHQLCFTFLSGQGVCSSTLAP